MSKRAFAIAAHPDDIEFLMAGTLILLGSVGYEIHYMTIANGSCGTWHETRAEIVRIRSEEAQAAAALVGATYHESLVDDIQIFYEPKLLARIGAIMREVAPEILLVHAPSDYMQDHENAARLAVTAAFCRAMPNFLTDPPHEPVEQAVTVYHAQPHGNREPMRQIILPDIFVDISGVMARKQEMLARHHSQKAWLDKTQGLGAYLSFMVEMGREVGKMSGRFEFAEGWRRRLHLGFSAEEIDPLSTALADYTLARQHKYPDIPER